MFRKLYEDNALGKLSDEQFAFLTSGYDEEKKTLTRRIAELLQEIDNATERSADVKRFVALVRKYTAITELTYENVHEFIDRIPVSYTHLQLVAHVPYAVIAPFVGIVFMVVYKVHRAKNDMVMDVSFVNVRREYILMLPLCYRVGKLLSDFMGFLIIYFPRLKGLYQMKG